MFMEPELEVTQVAKRLRVSEQTVRNYFREGRLRGYRHRYRGRWKVKESVLTAYQVSIEHNEHNEHIVTSR